MVRRSLRTKAALPDFRALEGLLGAFDRRDHIHQRDLLRVPGELETTVYARCRRDEAGAHQRLELLVEVSGGQPMCGGNVRGRHAPVMAEPGKHQAAVQRPFDSLTQSHNLDTTHPGYEKSRIRSIRGTRGGSAGCTRWLPHPTTPNVGPTNPVHMVWIGFLYAGMLRP